MHPDWQNRRGRRRLAEQDLVALQDTSPGSTRSVQADGPVVSWLSSQLPRTRCTRRCVGGERLATRGRVSSPASGSLGSCVARPRSSRTRGSPSEPRRTRLRDRAWRRHGSSRRVGRRLLRPLPCPLHHRVTTGPRGAAPTSSSRGCRHGSRGSPRLDNRLRAARGWRPESRRTAGRCRRRPWPGQGRGCQSSP